MKEERISYASAPDRLEIIWLQVKKHVESLAPDLKLQKPDWSKDITPWMGQTKKPAEFFLTFDGKKLTLEVRVGPRKKALGTQDLAAEKDLAKRRALLKTLSERSELASAADLAAFDKANPPPPDPKVQERINYLKNAIDNLKIIKGAPNYKYAKLSELGPTLTTEFKEWANKKGFGRYTSFIDDIEAGKDAGAIIEKYVAKGSASFVKLRDSTRATIEVDHSKGRKVDFSTARKEVVQVINQYVLPRFNSDKQAQLTDEIKRMETELKQLVKKK